MKLLLGDFNANVERENIFKPTTGDGSLHQHSNDNGVRIVKFATSKNLVVNSTIFPHRNIHKYTWTSPAEQNRNQIDHLLIDRRWHSSIIYLRSFSGAYCDTDHCQVGAKVRETLAVRKQTAHKFDGERFNLMKRNELGLGKLIRLRFQRVSSFGEIK